MHRNEQWLALIRLPQIYTQCWTKTISVSCHQTTEWIYFLTNLRHTEVEIHIFGEKKKKYVYRAPLLFLSPPAGLSRPYQLLTNTITIQSASQLFHLMVDIWKPRESQSKERQRDVCVKGKLQAKAALEKGIEWVRAQLCYRALVHQVWMVFSHGFPSILSNVPVLEAQLHNGIESINKYVYYGHGSLNYI